MNLARARRAFSPPERAPTFRSMPEPEKSMRPRSALMSSSFASGAACTSVSNAVRPRSRSSAWFCVK